MGHDPGGRHQGAHVDIVAAHVPDTHIASVGILRVDFACVGEPCLFLDRQRIELGAQHDGRTRAVLEDGNDSGASNVLGDCIALRL